MHKNSTEVQCGIEPECQSPDMLQTKTAFHTILLLHIALSFCVTVYRETNFDLWNVLMFHVVSMTQSQKCTVYNFSFYSLYLLPVI
jgi:hypothetical protein